MGVNMSMHKHVPYLLCMQQLSVVCVYHQDQSCGISSGLGTYLLVSRQAGCGQIPEQAAASPVVCLLCLITRQLFNYASCMPAFIAL